MKIKTDILLAAIEADDHLGFCLACGQECTSIEPDAQKYHCDACDEDMVYGAEEILMMGEHEE